MRRRQRFGRSALAAFEADLTTHEGLRSARSDAVTDERSAVVLRDQRVSDAWAWVDPVGAVLGTLACTDQIRRNEGHIAKGARTCDPNPFSSGLCAL
jgi:hypothetical protein